MRLFFVIFLVATAWSAGWAQVVTVKNKQSGEPIPDVYIFDLNGENSTTTDKNGKFDAGPFSQSEFVVLQHPAYFNYTLSGSDLSSLSEIQLSEKIVRMEELVVSANKWEQSSADIPSTIATIKARDIEFQNPQTAADILEGSGKVFVQKSQMGGGSPMIRGFSANSVLIVIDGVRMNNAIFRSGNLHNVISIDPSMVETAEVIFGPGSVIYGSDALGGVMDFHTITPTFSDELTTHSSIFGRYSSANNERSTSLKFSLSKNKFSLFTGFSYSNFSDLKAGSKRPDDHPDFGKRPVYQARINDSDVVINNSDENLQRLSGYRQWGGLAKLRFKIDEESDVTYGLYFSNSSDIPRYDRLILFDGATPRSAEWSYGPQKWLRNSLRYQSFSPKKIYNGMKAKLSYQTFEESRITRSFGSDIRTIRTEKVDLLSLNLDFDKKLTKGTNLYYGVEWLTNDVTSEAEDRNIVTNQVDNAQTRYPDGGSKYSTYAIYATLSKPLSPKIVLSGGGRFNHVNLSAQFIDKSFFDFPFDDLTLQNTAANGNLGLVIKPNPTWKMDAVVSSGFRAPNVDDMGKLFDSEPGNVLVPNSDLAPEKVLNIDLGVSKTFNDNFKVEITGFYSWVNNIIVRRDFLFNGEDSIMYDGVLSRVQALTNAENATIYGVSLYLKGQINTNLAFISTYTLTDGQDNEGQPIRHAAPAFGKTSLLFKKSNLEMELYTRYNGKILWEDLAPSEQNKPHLYTSEGALGWYTINYKLSLTLGDNFQVNAGVENIFDIHYRPYSSGISAPGRNYIISLKYSL